MDRGVFVGRAQELAQGRAMVDEALSGRTGLLLISGERGIGKTRLAEEIATYASLRGAHVLWGRALESHEGAPAYWPWIQALRGYVRNRDHERLRSELGSAGPEVAKIVSEVRERLPELPAPTPGDPAEERFRLFDAVGSFLRNASVSQPLLIVLDNLHWSDEPSLLLMQFLLQEVGEARLLLLGTYVEAELGRRHPLSKVLGGLRTERRFRSLGLRGLGVNEVQRLIGGIAGQDKQLTLAEAVHRQTDGNPLFVNEVVRYWIDQGLIILEGGRWRATGRRPLAEAIPSSAREVIGGRLDRLDRLSEEAIEALTMAAVAGREFDLALLRELTGQEEDKVLEHLELAMRAQLVEEVVGSSSQYRFVHGLTRDALALNGEESTDARPDGRSAGAHLQPYSGAACGGAGVSTSIRRP